MTDVNESWSENVSTRPTGMQQCVISTRYICRNDMSLFDYRFKGSDDYLRAKVYLKPCLAVRLDLIFVYFLVRRIYHGCASVSEIPRLYYQGRK